MLDIGYVEGRAELLEDYYCNKKEDDLKEFGLGNSVKSFPPLPSDLDFYKDKTFKVRLFFTCYLLSIYIV